MRPVSQYVNRIKSSNWFDHQVTENCLFDLCICDSEGRILFRIKQEKEERLSCRVRVCECVCGLFCANRLAEMSNCFSSPDDSKDEAEFKPAKARGCTDVFWLVIYVVFWLFMVSECSIKWWFLTENFVQTDFIIEKQNKKNSK